MGDAVANGRLLTPWGASYPRAQKRETIDALAVCPELKAQRSMLIGVADRATRNWFSAPSRMAADFVAKRIQTGAQFETFPAGEAGPCLQVDVREGEAAVVVGGQNAETGISLKPTAEADAASPRRDDIH